MDGNHRDPTRTQQKRRRVSNVKTAFAFSSDTFPFVAGLSLPPVLEHGPPPHILYNAGKTISLPCQVKAPPYPPPTEGPQAPNYTWYKDGAQLDRSAQYSFHSHGGGTSLRISTLAGSRDKSDPVPVEGYFQCKVSNDRGTAMSNVSLLQAAGECVVDPLLGGRSRVLY